MGIHLHDSVSTKIKTFLENENGLNPFNPEDIDMLQDMIVAAINSALQKAQEALKAEMAKVTGGMNMPGLF